MTTSTYQHHRLRRIPRSSRRLQAALLPLTSDFLITFGRRCSEEEFESSKSTNYSNPSLVSLTTHSAAVYLHELSTVDAHGHLLGMIQDELGKLQFFPLTIMKPFTVLTIAPF